MSAGSEGSTADRSLERFQVLPDEWDGARLLVLRDVQAGSEIRLAPELGFSCFAFRVSTKDGIWQVLDEPPDSAALRQRSTRHGIPILYPWPNRIRNGQFSFGGREYQLPRPPGQEHASHGFARLWPWTVQRTGADAMRAFCRASVTLGGPDGGGWPFHSHLIVEYALADSILTLRAEATNLGRQPMPMGFGLHPWFTLPLSRDGTRGTSELRIPAGQVWELDQLIPTGRRLPVDQGFDARNWRALGDAALDDVYTDLDLEGGWFTAEVREPQSNRRIAVRSDSAFREHVVYAPPNRSTLCLEPYTCPTDAFNLLSRGIDAGVIILDPGERWTGRVEIIATA